jgi:hypothetical protein
MRIYRERDIDVRMSQILRYGDDITAGCDGVTGERVAQVVDSDPGDTCLLDYLVKYEAYSALIQRFFSSEYKRTFLITSRQNGL